VSLCLCGKSKKILADFFVKKMSQSPINTGSYVQHSPHVIEVGDIFTADGAGSGGVVLLTTHALISRQGWSNKHHQSI